METDCLFFSNIGFLKENLNFHSLFVMHSTPLTEPTPTCCEVNQNLKTVFVFVVTLARARVRHEATVGKGRGGGRGGEEEEGLARFHSDEGILER
jgi:hypothetical protein